MRLKYAALSAVLIALASGAGINQVSDSGVMEQFLACSCDGQVVADLTLPLSHPQNRCAMEQQSVSWFSWLRGGKQSAQFHYLDLLELLSRNDDHQ